MRCLTYILCLFCFGAFSQMAPQSKEFKIVLDMLDSIKHVKYVRMELKALERTEQGYLSATSLVKLQVNPRRLYFYNPEKKLEILYNAGQLNNKCVVKPHVFPYITLLLDPLGNLMRKNQHYTVHEIGFEFIGRTIALALAKEKENIAKSLSYVGQVEKNGRKCHMLIYESKAFAYTDYVVQKKETIGMIAVRLNVNDYMLRLKNNMYNDYGYVKTGTILKVPVMYCKKGVFYVDEKSMLPISVSIYDDVGLFESYDFSISELNKPIPDAEFRKDYKDYHF
ncbi:MAG: DUF1571 domain-containing protein [Bacteroidetes bacterium]|nr:DUF1571 domain-containing protein [Bacteroidota bacterium]